MAERRDAGFLEGLFAVFFKSVSCECDGAVGV